MAQPSSPTLRSIRNIDRSLPDFHGELYNALLGDEYLRCLPNLKHEDLTWFVDYLDEVLDPLEHPSDSYQQCLQELGKLCSMGGILPTPYVIPAQSLNVDPQAFASGGLGNVYEGTLDNSRIRIKRVWVDINDSQEKALKAFCRDVVTWNRLAHPNVMPIRGVTISPWLQIASDWMTYKILPEYIKITPGANLVQLLSDAAQGLEYLHSSNIVHGDLEGRNILVDGSGHACVADFGLAAVSQASAPHHSGPVPRWAAPEVLKERKYGTEADVFSFAMVVIEVFNGEVQFTKDADVTAAFSIMQGERPPRPARAFFTDDLWSLTQRCWDSDPQSRPNASEVSQILRTFTNTPWKQLITQALSIEERTSLIAAIFLDTNQINTVGNLSRNDTQTFIDKTYEGLDGFEPEARGKYLHHLSRICGRQALLPRPLEISPHYDPTEDPVSRSGLVEIRNGQYEDRDVVVHVLRILQGEDAEQIKRRFCREVVTWRALHHPNVLPLLGVAFTENRLVMVSECITRSNIVEFTKAYIGVDRFGLLVETAKGLTYLHAQGVIHGDLNGSNVLIDNDGHVRLTGFSVSMIASTMRYAPPVDTTIPWKSPELLFPVKFGLAESKPTKESDCYALGMVIYEVLSGQVPFAASWSFQVAFTVLEGKRPARPEGEGTLFTDEIWKTLEDCWEQQPGERPSIEEVLTVLEWDPSLPKLPIGCGDEGPQQQVSGQNKGWFGTLVGGVGRFFGLVHSK